MKNKTKQKLAIFGLLSLFAISLCGCDTFDFIFWQRYQNKDYKFSMLLPRSWEKEIPGPEYNVLMIAKKPLKDMDKYQENITVNVTEFPKEAKSLSLGTIFEMNKDEIKAALADMYDLKEGDIYAGFLPGRWLSFEGKAMGIDVKIISAIWLKNNRTYVVTCSAETKEYPRFEPIFLKALHSVRIK